MTRRCCRPLASRWVCWLAGSASSPSRAEGEEGGSGQRDRERPHLRCPGAAAFTAAGDEGQYSADGRGGEEPAGAYGQWGNSGSTKEPFVGYEDKGRDRVQSAHSAAETPGPAKQGW